MELPERLKIARESAGKTQKEMAAAIDVSVTAVQSYESGRQVPGGKVFEALAKMGFDTNWLLTGEGEMRREKEAKRELVQEPQPTYAAPQKRLNDAELVEIMDILQHDLPEAKKFVLKVLRGRKEVKEGLEGLGMKLKEEN